MAVKAFKVIRDPKAFELMADETRRRMVFLLRAKDLTVSQIADQLNKTPQAIYHHVKKLLEAGMVEVAKEERVDHFIETYYRATAEVFNFIHGEGHGNEVAEQHTREALQALQKLGLSVRIDEAMVSRLVNVMKKMEAFEQEPQLEEKIAELEDVDFITKQEVSHYVKYLSLSDKQFEELLGMEREFREILRSALVEPVEATVRKRKSK